MCTAFRTLSGIRDQKDPTADLKNGGGVDLGHMLGAVIILPSVYAFLHNARVDTAVEEAQNFYSIAHYRKMILGFFQTLPMTNGWTVHGTAIGGLAGVLMLFTSKKRSREIAS